MQLPAIFREPAIADPPRRVWRDWVLLAVIVVAALLAVVFTRDDPYLLFVIGLTVLVAPTVMWRRVLPLQMMAISWAVLNTWDVVHQVLTGTPTVLFGGVIILLTTQYAVFRWGSGPDMIKAIGLMLLTWMSDLIVDPSSRGDAVGALIALSVLPLIGLFVRSNVQMRARRLEQARLSERERLARELHDSVAHHVSAIIIQAQAGTAVAALDPTGAAAALERIEATAHEAMREMRSMVGTLRSPASLTPQSRWTDIHQLANAVPDSIAISIDLPEDDPAPGPVQAAAYRIVQESVTNAVRHARNISSIDVTIQRADDRDDHDDDAPIIVRVVNDGRNTGAPADPGYGLTGMQERCEQLGGALTAGPADHGGWAVVATLPTGGGVNG